MSGANAHAKSKGNIYCLMLSKTLLVSSTPPRTHPNPYAVFMSVMPVISLTFALGCVDFPVDSNTL